MSEFPPFGVLGIAPTRDMAVIKRAYFAALKLHPPHKDAAAFQRLRTAYETLSSPAKLAAAYLGAPIDAKAELAAYAELEAGMHQAAEARQTELSADERTRRFFDEVSPRSWSEILERFAG